MPDLEDQALEVDASQDRAETEPSGIPLPSLQSISWSLIAGGALGALANLLTGRRRLMDWIVPVSLLGLGAGVLLQQRQTRLEATQQTIIAELDALDPVARAQVLQAVAKDQLGWDSDDD